MKWIKISAVHFIVLLLVPVIGSVGKGGGSLFGFRGVLYLVKIGFSEIEFEILSFPAGYLLMSLATAPVGELEKTELRSHVITTIPGYKSLLLIKLILLL